MASYDDSFNATGPTFATFETVGELPSNVPKLGVAVFSHQCGVNGVALSDVPAGSHRNAPNLVGVHGLGENEGVQGEGPIGVRGIARVFGTLGGQGTGVQGEGGQIGVRGEGEVGVIGESRTLGRGAAGVVGIGESIGMHGISERGRGGVFQTRREEAPPVDPASEAASAQVRLVPVRVAASAESSLPRDGLAGDLYAAVDVREARVATAQLWFCVRSGSSDLAQPAAVWRQVQLI